jgi:HNH endonuclease
MKNNFSIDWIEKMNEITEYTFEEFPRYIVYKYAPPENTVWDTKMERFVSAWKKKSIHKGRGKRINFYWEVDLYNEEGRYHKKISILKARAFIPNPENKPIVDHINGDTLNDEISNLRWSTHAENSQNSQIHIDNEFGHKNISITPSETYCVTIMVGGVKYHKTFPTLEEAEAYAHELRQKLHGEFAHD